MPLRPIYIVGSLNIDLVTVTERVPNGGETLESLSFHSGFGGKGANQAVAAARLVSPDVLQVSPGLIRMVGAVGDDQFGRDFLSQLEHKEGIQTSGITVRAGERTGTSVIIVEKQNGENRILYSPGANSSLVSSEISFETTQAGQHPSLAVLQLEIPLEVVLATLRRAREQGLETILNPAPAKKLPDSAYKDIDHLILNESEAGLLMGVSEKKLTSDLGAALQFFLNKGVRSAIITLGAKGAVYASRSTIGNGYESEPALKVNVVDTTAAGDTFVGAFAVYLSEHGSDSLGPAVKFAISAASLTVQREGAQASIPTISDL